MNYIGIISLTSSYFGLLVFSTLVRPDSESFKLVIKKKIDAKAEVFTKCFTGEPPQFINLSWAIQSNGALANLQVRNSNLEDSEENCFLENIRKMKFPRPPTSSIVTITHKFESVKIEKKKTRKKNKTSSN